MDVFHLDLVEMKSSAESCRIPQNPAESSSNPVESCRYICPNPVQTRFDCQKLHSIRGEIMRDGPLTRIAKCKHTSINKLLHTLYKLLCITLLLEYVLELHTQYFYHVSQLITLATTNPSRYRNCA